MTTGLRSYLRKSQNVQHPGAHGSTHWYINDQGVVEYGDRPVHEVRTSSESVTPFVTPDVAEQTHKYRQQSEDIRSNAGIATAGAISGISSRLKMSASRDDLLNLCKKLDIDTVPEIISDDPARNASLVVSIVIQAWYGFAHEPRGIAIRRLIAHEFSFTNWSTRPQKVYPKDWRASESIVNDPDVAPVIRSVFRAMYEHTQEELKKQGISHLALVRGVKSVDDPAVAAALYRARRGGSGEAGIARFTGDSASSFSLDPHLASQYGDMVLVGSVPRSHILSTWGTGMGFASQSEVIVLGSEPWELHWATQHNKTGDLGRYAEAIQENRHGH